MNLDPAAAASGVRLLVLDSIGSTNAEGLRLARGGERGPLWVVARRQETGRGRRGRPWASEPGNLFASLLVVDPGPSERAAELSFVAALAAHDAIVEAAPGLSGRVALKWPNDVLVDGAKVAGILIEGEGTAQGPLAVVVGIGINVTGHPDATPYPATDLARAGAGVTAEALFRRLSAAMAARLTQWDRSRGFAAIREAWLAAASGIGAEIRVRLPDRELSGRFERLDDAGRLVLLLSDGRREAVTSGEVFPVGGAGNDKTRRTAG